MSAKMYFNQMVFDQKAGNLILKQNADALDNLSIELADFKWKEIEQQNIFIHFKNVFQ